MDHALPTNALDAANDLFDLCTDWKENVRILEWLRKHDEHFESKEFCYLKVIAVDTLYSTNLRYQPGRRLELSSRILEKQRVLTAASTQPPNFDLVLQLAKTKADKTGNVSFASKFFHFFISSDYPIFDTLANDALKKSCPDLKRTPYSAFATSIQSLAANTNRSIQQVDRFLWLFGSYLEWTARLQQKGPPKRLNEVQRLFHSQEPSICKLVHTLANSNPPSS
jgi:hypothetical protein